MSKYGAFSGPIFPVFSPNRGKYGLENTPYLDAFQVVQTEPLKQKFEDTFFI